MKNEKLTVLVLGVGGSVSQGILKALALSNLDCRVVGACVSPLAMGLYTVDRSYVCPPAASPDFLPWLIETSVAEGVGVILSGVEPVLAVLSEHVQFIRERTGAICIVSSPEAIRIGGDKLLTCQWLEQQGLNFPRYASSTDTKRLAALVAECGYPLFAKPLNGKGGRGIFELRNDADLAFIGSRNDYIVQELLGDADHEYTVGCFSDSEGKVRGAIAMRRDLLSGTTARAEVGRFDDVCEEAVRIAQALRPMGPCNIQLRTSGGRPVCFEVNVRFSGTTPVRARLGFNEVEAAIRHYALGEPAVDLPRITKGIMLRYWNEVYVDTDAYATLSKSSVLDNPKLYELEVEDYGMRKEAMPEVPGDVSPLTVDTPLTHILH